MRIALVQTKGVDSSSSGSSTSNTPDSLRKSSATLQLVTNSDAMLHKNPYVKPKSSIIKTEIAVGNIRGTVGLNQEAGRN